MADDTPNLGSTQNPDTAQNPDSTPDQRPASPAAGSESGGIDDALAREIDAALGDQSLDALMADDGGGDESDSATATARTARGGTARKSPKGGRAGRGAGGKKGPRPPEPELRKGKILAISGDDVFVEVGGRTQGVLEAGQFAADKPPVIGEEVEYFVEKYDQSEGLFILSRKGVAQKAAWSTLAKGQIVEARVTGVNKGGLECDLNGIRAFMPASQLDMVRVQDTSTFIGQKLTCLITELDRRESNVVLSRRKLMEQAAAEAREETMKTLAADQVRDGTVRSIMPYGAFIDLGGIDGLLHVSDMSHSRTADPAKVVTVGQQVKVKVLKIEEGGKRISLGMKQLLSDPWEGVATRYTKGKSAKGKISSLAKFGAFVEIEPGLEALIPISEITYKKRINHPSEVLSLGMDVEVGILEIDPVRKRMSVSLKAFEPDPWVGVEKKYMLNTAVTGTVTRVVDFGAFVELEPGVEGLIHVSELSDKPVNRAADAVRGGQQVEVRVIGVNPEDRRISLSLKAMAPEREIAAEAKGGPAGAAATPAEPPKPAKKRKTPLLGGLE